MEVANFGNFDVKSLEKHYNDALKDPVFSELVNSLNLSHNELMKRTSLLEESTSEFKNCASCPGLAMCKNKVKGFVNTPHNYENRLNFDYVACRYKQKEIEEINTSCNYFKMPEAIKKASMKNIKIDDANRVPAIKWLKSFYDNYDKEKTHKGLYLHGSFGSGKTYLISAMLNELSKKGVDITIVYYPELLRSLKESFDSDFSSRIEKLKRVSILFLDDIGAEAVTPWARDEILGTILQYRMDEGLPTFFTSNLSLEELEVHLSSTSSGVERVKARRIMERIKFLAEDISLISKNRRV